ncbi:hypothetical protein V6O07_10585 [Arthrospira platensis SPKY2]
MFFNTSYLDIKIDKENLQAINIEVLPKEEYSKGVSLNILAEELDQFNYSSFVILLDYKGKGNPPSWEIGIAIAMKLKLNKALAVYSPSLPIEGEERNYTIVSTTNKEFPLYGIISVNNNNEGKIL